MSVAICDKCSDYIDCDEDPDSTYFNMKFICASCRERLTPEEEAEHQRILNA